VDYFNDISSIHSYNTRATANKNLFLPRKNLNYGKFGVKVAAVSNWNEIPIGIKNCTSITVFKKDLKTFLLSK